MCLDPVYVTVNSMHTIRTAARRIVDTRLKQNMDVSTDDLQRPHRDFLDLVIDTDSGLPAGQKKVAHSSQATEAMVDQILAFVGAGHETIAGAVSWVFWSINYCFCQSNTMD
jgi:cytochrome P450